jgi:hypothetical protein
MSNQLTLPIYDGTAITANVTFTLPTYGATPNNWPVTDPTSVSLTVSAPNGVTTYNYGQSGFITRLSVGVYTAELDTTNLPGNWMVQWQSTGVCAAVWAGGFQVVPSPL